MSFPQHSSLPVIPASPQQHATQPPPPPCPPPPQTRRNKPRRTSYHPRRTPCSQSSQHPRSSMPHGPAWHAAAFDRATRRGAQSSEDSRSITLAAQPPMQRAAAFDWASNRGAQSSQTPRSSIHTAYPIRVVPCIDFRINFLNFSMGLKLTSQIQKPANSAPERATPMMVKMMMATSVSDDPEMEAAEATTDVTAPCVALAAPRSATWFWITSLTKGTMSLMSESTISIMIR
mmetsp:Transcript_43913/g.107307  ORF Transcript_43913/g.107307 Transcript_43913/m.107307 type:complete len:232 (+) Transcript_43913:126-821(+)